MRFRSRIKSSNLGMSVASLLVEHLNAQHFRPPLLHREVVSRQTCSLPAVEA
jgi:hypothetical protein